MDGVWIRCLVAAVAVAVTSLAAAQTSTVEAQSRALERASEATLGLRAQAVDDARSARTLGRQRAGSGVVIAPEGLVLTIGYLILEADVVELLTAFGLVQALAPIRRAVAPLGVSANVRREDPLIVMSGGTAGAASAARLVSRRAFSGYWEYHVDGALFTSPPRADHSGAALFNLDGELLGIGSLVLDDATEGERVPGNMFVPIDLLKPILGELRASGSSRASARAWIGINCVDTGGQIRIVRVNDDSPADVAGLQAGDRIVGIDGVAVARLEQLWKALWAGTSPEREVKLDIVREGQPQTLSVQTVDRAKTLKRPQGV
jgi:S1-C subfamily serine protease